MSEYPITTWPEMPAEGWCGEFQGQWEHGTGPVGLMWSRRVHTADHDSCGVCVFWLRKPGTEDGYCRRRAPVAIMREK